MTHDANSNLDEAPLGTVSIRIFWPFARALGNYEIELAILKDGGVDVASFADPRTRIPKALGRRMVCASLQKSGDASLGLHAGERVELADFGPIDQMTRHCETLRDAVLNAGKYTKLHDEGARSELIETDTLATLRIVNEEPHRHAVTNEFQVMSTLKRLGFFVHRDVIALEVHLRNEAATSLVEYQRAFRCPIRLGAEHNAVVVPRELLDTRARSPNPNLLPLFQEQADRTLREVQQEASFTQRVRDLLERGLEEGLTTMPMVARRLNLSEATLRRRLGEEQVTHKELLDRVRRERALSHVASRRASLGEIGFRLGFSSPSAFGRAFRRWVGVSPVEYRSRRKEQ